MGGSGSEELKECHPPSLAVLWFMNGSDRKPRQKKKKKEEKRKQNRLIKLTKVCVLFNITYWCLSSVMYVSPKWF